jgi:hypothetical protein
MAASGNRALCLLAMICFALQACSAGAAQTNADGPQPVGSEAPFAPFAELESIELLTLASGVGPKPRFEWMPVQDAVRYSLLVQFADGEPYWAWGGSETSVYLGGAHSSPPPNASGPLLQPGMAWSVIAFDAEHNVIATSGLQLISP